VNADINIGSIGAMRENIGSVGAMRERNYFQAPQSPFVQCRRFLPIGAGPCSIRRA
jgi:hypothetical protein